MISLKTVPIHPFWKFSVKFYSEPTVEEALLTLQNERGLNINILLFCCWYALGDQGRLTKIELRQLLVNVQSWHDRIVLPLRRLRSQLKSAQAHPWPAIRAEVLKQELFSEQIEQLILLEGVVFKAQSVRTSTQKVRDICKSIAAYCQTIQIFCDTKDCVLITQILQTLFPKIDQKNILRYCMDHLVTKELQSLTLSAQLPLDL